MKNTNSILKIKRLPSTRMLKSEMADYIEKAIGIFEKYEPESELIAPVFELLKGKEPDIKLLRLSYGIDTERLRVSKLMGDMMLKISTLKLKVRILSKSQLALDIHLVENAINSHLRYLDKCRNDKQLNQKVAGFLDLISENAELGELIDEHDLGGDVENIKVAHVIMNAATKKRVKMLSQRPAVPTKDIVKGMAQAIDNLFKGIEVGHLLSTLADGEEEGEQTDFVPLIDELNQLSEMYNRSISIRDANNKRKALKNEGDNGEDDDGLLEEGNTPEEVQSTDMGASFYKVLDTPTIAPIDNCNANATDRDTNTEKDNDQEEADALI